MIQEQSCTQDKSQPRQEVPTNLVLHWNAAAEVLRAKQDFCLALVSSCSINSCLFLHIKRTSKSLSCFQTLDWLSWCERLGERHLYWPCEDGETLYTILYFLETWITFAVLQVWSTSLGPVCLTGMSMFTFMELHLSYAPQYLA